MDKVLIVDDDAAFRGLLRRWVEGTGAVVLEASMAEEAAWLVANEGTVAVALCDVWLPGKGGLWLIEHLRTNHPETAVVMTTAAQDFDVAVASIETGVVDYVVKPFTRERLLAAVKKACAAHMLRQSFAAVEHAATLAREAGDVVR